LSDQVRTVRLPLNKAGDLNKFNKIQNRLNQKLEREPTDDEINQACAEAGLKVDGVRTLAIQNPLSLDSTSQFEDDTALINITPDRDTPPPDAGLINESIKIEINDILKSLHPKESHIIKSLFGLDCKPKTLEELGVELNLTRERVRQININAFRKLRIHKKNPILRQYLG
jgi:RNA polymerase primary sigma factor